MRAEESNRPSIAGLFRRDYFLASILPLTVFLILVLIAAHIGRGRVESLIAESVHELNLDAKRNLETLGESVIRNRARHVALQVAEYFEDHPGTSIEVMREDPYFRDLAMQKVGDGGYTAITEAGGSRRIVVHPNPEIVDKQIRDFAEKMPAWFEIAQRGITGNETSGYYDWIEPDGSTRTKYLFATPASVKIDGVTMMVAATSYIDEFSAPVAAMETRADEIVGAYHDYVAIGWQRFAIAFVCVLTLALIGTIALGTRAAGRLTAPIEELADIVRESDGRSWAAHALDPIAIRTDEIGTLARAFQTLTAQTVVLFDRLEERVGELNEAKGALGESKEHYRQLYEEAKKTEAIYRSLLHTSADAIAMVDMEMKVTYLSPSFTRIFGWTQKDLEGTRIPYVPEEELSKAVKILGSVASKGEPFAGYEGRRLTKSGDLVDVSVSASRFHDHEGKPAGVLAITRDITEAKRVKAQIQHLDRLEAVGTLAGGVAHDFNNLLTVVQGNVSLLKSTLEPPKNDDPGDGAPAKRDEIWQSLVEIEDQIQSGASLTRQLLGYARKGRYEVEVADLNDAVRKVSETIRRTRKEIVVHYDLTEDLLPVEADFHQLEQVILNLDINACDAMPDGGELRIATLNAIEAGQDMVVLSVQDNGMGMDADVVDRIFDPFFTTKDLERGTGLGLASAYGIVESHGGRIEVHSRPGEGTTFRVLLPAAEDVQQAEGDETEAIAPGVGRVLIVDDEEMVLRVCARMTGSLGYDVRTALGGEAGIEAYREHADEIDVVILDMIMPGTNGSQVFEALREMDPDVCVILSSGYSIDSKATESMIRECKGSLQKPYTVEELASKLESAMPSDEEASTG